MLTNHSCLFVRVTVLMLLPWVVRVDASAAASPEAPGTSWISRLAPVSGPDQDWSVHDKGGAYAKREGALIRIGNATLERVYRLSDDTVSTAQFINKLNGREPGSQQGGEFSCVLHGSVEGEFCAADFKLKDIAVASNFDPLGVRFALDAREHPGLAVQILVETGGNAKYQRRWLNIIWSGDGDVVVERVDVENTGGFGWWFEGNPSHDGMGQPLLVNDLYFGLEYPGGEVTNEYLRHFPGRSAKDGLTTKTAIWGVAKSAALTRQAFFEDYLDTIAGPRPAPFVIWNLISTGTPEESRLLREIKTTAARAKDAGLAVDSYAIDDVWQDYTSVWQPDPIRFPRGFAPLGKALDSVGSRLGLWLALDGVSLDTRWGKVRGLEVSQVGYRGPTSGRYCIAGPRYKAELERVVDSYLGDQKVNYFKCDYNTFGCEDASHGHGIGPAGREAQIDAFLDVLKHIKAVTPECRIALTTGMWLSPWWTLDADYIWLGGNDMGEMPLVHNLTPQDSAMTYRDGVLYEDFVEKKYVFPFSSLMIHGFWEVGGAPYDKFQDDVIMTVGRGIAKYEILNAPSAMDDKRLGFLARAIRWGKENWEILSDTRMILGDPRKGQPYGFAHVGPTAALVFLRNPDIESKAVPVAISDLGIGPDAKLLERGQLKAFEVYPATVELDWNGETTTPIAVHVLGSQTKVIAIVSGAGIPERLRIR